MSENNNVIDKTNETIKEGGDIQPKVITKEKKNPEIPPRPIIKLENVVEEEEYSTEEYEEYIKMYSETLMEINEGEIVKGRILSINDREVAVDIGFKSEGTIQSAEFDSLEDLRIGDEIEVFLDSVEDRDGQLVLSKQKADFTRIWEKIIDSFQNEEVLEGKCLRRIKGGIVVDIMGIDAFLPGSQIDVKPIRNFDAFIGQTLPLKVVKVNDLRKNIVVSRRVLIEGDQAELREKILTKLEKGKNLEGSVKNITDFGVFVDLGGVDGLLHITDLSWGRVSHPSEIVSLDEKIIVRILDFDDNKERISLGLKQLTPHPWENINEKYQVGQRIKGKAVSITDYGVFVELEKGIEGLVHISEMSWTQHIKHPSKFVSVGEELEVVILNINKEGKKISMGLKQIEPDPWMAIEEKYSVDSRHPGKVINVTDFGVFVELEEGIDGLIHISDLSWTKKVRHPSEVVKKGDEIEIVILGISKKDRRISLGHKQIDENPWDKFEEIYLKDSETNGKVVRLIEKGLIIELPDKVEGFVPFSQLQKVDAKIKDKSFKIGDEFPLKVIEFNKNQKKIVLSYDKLIVEKEREEVDKFVKTQKESKKETIGDMISENKGKTEKVEVTAAPAEEPKTEKPAEEKIESEIKTELKSENVESIEVSKEEAKAEKPEEETIESTAKSESISEQKETSETSEEEAKAEKSEEEKIKTEEKSEIISEKKEPSDAPEEGTIVEKTDAGETESQDKSELEAEDKVKKKDEE